MVRKKWVRRRYRKDTQRYEYSLEPEKENLKEEIDWYMEVNE